MANRVKDLRILFALLWLAFTSGLAIWMLIFNLSLFRKVATLTNPEALDILRYHRMVILEMFSLILSLMLGGAWLFWLIYQERRQAKSIQNFFATFTHEMKTALSRLRLQTENIMDDFRSSQLGRPAVQLLEDLSRLEVQLENSLFIARGIDHTVFIQDVPLSRIIAGLSPQFPLQVHLSKDAVLKTDKRALESILKNLMQNAVVHGEAQNLWIEPKSLHDGKLSITVRNDGKAFLGDLQVLGKQFVPQGPTGGSGIGLYLAKSLLENIGGRLHFDNQKTESGFSVSLEIPGELKGGKK